MNKRQSNKIKSNQVKYKKLRVKARVELVVLEEYFGKGRLDEKTIYTEIKKHLEAHQKEISYFGLRGVLIGLASAIFVYLFNTQVSPNITQIYPEIGNGVLTYILNLLGAILVVIIFLFMYFIATGDILIADLKRRNQIYINEYILKIVDEKLDEIKGKTGA